MTIRKIIFLLASSLTLLLGGRAACAAQYDFKRGIYAWTDYADVHFVEIDQQDEVINEEEDVLLFSGLGIYWQFASGLFLETNFKSADDTLTYRGLNQVGRFTESKTEYYIRDGRLLLGRRFGPTAAYLGVGSRYRERNILASGEVGGLYEEMDHTYGMFGLRATLLNDKPFQIRLDGHVWTDVAAELTVDSEHFDPTTFDLGQQIGIAGSIEFLFHLFSGVSLSVIPSYQYTHMEQSDTYKIFDNGRHVIDARHPEAEYEALSLSAKLSWFF